jgi:hypothetical protein
MEQERRAVDRQLAEWVGRYRVDGDPENRWRYCRIVDISSAGAALDLADANPEEIANREIVVEVFLRGDVRHSQLGDDEQVKVGVQFVDLSDNERSHLDQLRALRVGW